MGRVLIFVCVVMLVSACNLSEQTPDTVPPTATNDTPLTPFPTRTPATAPQQTATPLPIGVNPVPTLAFQGGGASGGTTDVITTLPDNIRDSFPVTANAGQTLVVSYNVTFNAPGELFIYVTDAQEIVLDSIRIVASIESELTVDVPTTGTYTVSVAFDSLPGTYSLSYSLR